VVAAKGSSLIKLSIQPTLVPNMEFPSHRLLFLSCEIVLCDRSHKTARIEQVVHDRDRIDMSDRVAAGKAARYMRAMKVKDADILIVPGYTNSGPEHWQTRWQSKLSTARRVEQAEWTKPVREDWTASVANAVNEAERPVVLVAHSLGVAAAVQAIPQFRKPVAGAFFVAPPDVANPDIRPRHLMTFGPYSRDPLPFPSIVIASRNDPFCAFEVAEDIAAAWGSLFIDAGEAGHLNHDAGFGPWPEGSMTFAKFLTELKQP
jgi:predicted alpha/beta hydrolase family esterase